MQVDDGRLAGSGQIVLGLLTFEKR
jgi:hypothetical protein